MAWYHLLPRCIKALTVCSPRLNYCIVLFCKACQKAEKNRQKAEEVFLKNAHAQRQEAAQLRREEKRRQEKEKMLNEEDPDKARKLEVNIAILTLYSLFIPATSDCPCILISDSFLIHFWELTFQNILELFNPLANDKIMDITKLKSWNTD